MFALRKSFALLLVVTILLIAAKSAMAEGSCLRAGELPGWKVNLVLSFPTIAERPGLLWKVVSEHYALENAEGVDAQGLLQQMLPSLIAGAKDSESLTAELTKALGYFHCSSSGRGSSEELAAKTADESDTHELLKKAEAASERGLQELQEHVPCLVGMSNHDHECSCRMNAGSVEAHAPIGCDGSLDERTHRLHRANLASFAVIRDADKQAEAVDSGSAEAKRIKGHIGNATSLINQSTSIDSIREPRNGLFVGPSFSLKDDGGWENGGEIVAQFESGVKDPLGMLETLCPNFDFVAWCRMGSEFSYRTIGALDTSTDMPASAAGRSNAKADGSGAINPFDKSGGFFRMTGHAQIHFSEWFGIQGILGLSALHTGSSDGLITQPRVGIGAHFQTLYADGALGQMFVGYVHDRVWRRDVPIDAMNPETEFRDEKNYNRWLIDGLFFLPSVEIGGFRVAARLTADAPINHRGPSDVRASLLFHHDFGAFVEGFDPSK
jgi:hypothetical protein